MNIIANSLKTYIQGSTATKYRELGKTYDVYVRLEDDSRQNLEDIENLAIVAPLSQARIKLSNIARIYEGVSPLSIDRQNRERVVRVECNTYNRSSGKVVEDIESQLQHLVIPANIMVNFGGEQRSKERPSVTCLTIIVRHCLSLYDYGCAV